ncbi:MAG: Type secretion system protein [Candidatus Saccharibacteria bacterium]|nr:Type secretion system protein [Candidatus Saccharibacteria bacterium]
MKPWAKQKGFTIVELLIVIVVIGILAAITIVAYNGIQQRGRDAQRQSDIKTVAKALEMYYLDEGRFPPAQGSASIGSGWSSTADNSWANLAFYLVPKYISALPRDPISTPGTNITNAQGYNYGFFADKSGYYCNPGVGQVYILVFRLESSSQENTLQGICTTGTGGPYALSPYSNVSNYRIVK